MRFSPHAIIVAAVLWLGGDAAAAQTLRGRVIDASTFEPVGDVQLRLLRRDSTRVAQIVTDPTGRFFFTPADSGAYRLEATHIAYRSTLSDFIEIRRDEEVIVDLKLATLPIELDPLTVVARRGETRHDATPEGLYTRYAQFPTVGSRRIFLPWDPAMRHALDVGDVLRWVPRTRGCRVVYWNGLLQDSPRSAQARLEMPVSFLEGVEYYRSMSDAPLAYRDVPAYLAECTRFYVIALWPRTDRYALETEPPWYPPPPPSRAVVNAVAYSVSGPYAPGPGGGIEAAAHLEFRRYLQIGIVVRGTMHSLSADTTLALSAPLNPAEYVLPAGSRDLQLWAIGADLRATPVRRERVHVSASARLQIAGRRFSLRSQLIGSDEVPLTSPGWGYGGTVAVELRIAPRLAFTTGLGLDVLEFREYRAINRRATPARVRWTGSALKLGLAWR